MMSFQGRFDLNETSASVPSPSSYNPSLRRPWSPTRSNADVTDNGGTSDYLEQDQIPCSILRENRQVRPVQIASEHSVEALDLADYAKTLRGPMRESNNPYPPIPHTSHPLTALTPVHPISQPAPYRSYPEYPSSPDNRRPFSPQSRDTFSHTPPSLVSGDTSHDSHDSYRSHHPYPMRQPYSLPSFITPLSTGHLSTRDPGSFAAISDSPRHSAIRIASPVPDERDEADISRFPAFSRGWYDDPDKAGLRKNSSLPPYSSEFQYDHAGSYNHISSTVSNQARNILPWGSQLSEPSRLPVDDAVKEERIRMLQHEFGKKGKPEAIGEPIVGSVDEKGALITVGPKKRVIARWAQGILALATAVSSLYGALFIKTSTHAPPASTLPAFVLYASSTVTFLFLFYLFAIRPCCRGKRSKSVGHGVPNMGGIMVLPVQRLPGEQRKKKKGKNNKQGGSGDVQVNLIVDPSMFGGSARDEEYESDSDHNFGGSQVSSRRPGEQKQMQQRRSLFEGLAMENDWNVARKSLKRMLLIDIACLVIWAGVFILVLFGKKCPPGGFNGWCNSYNIASATACILCLAFGFSVFFDIVDLHMSKASPRTRT